MFFIEGLAENKFLCLFFVLTKTARTLGKEDEGCCMLKGGVKASKAGGKSLLPSAVQCRLNPNNFIGIIASE